MHALYWSISKYYYTWSTKQKVYSQLVETVTSTRLCAEKIVLSLTLKKEGEPLEPETSDFTGNVVPELGRFWAEKPVNPGGSWLEFSMDFPEQKIVFCYVKDLFHEFLANVNLLFKDKAFRWTLV